ncbi:MAG TPA: DUF3343 domain-containing protein [Syntrophomonas sp.]|nr:DUF3343 domain-containing protein [Syntrophomonas sp.]
MDNNLLNIEEFCLFTFASTSAALKAESVLKAQSFEHIMIPTLREISSSCGLSVKIRPEDLESCRQILADHRIKIEKCYYVRKDGGKYKISEVAF